MAHFAGSKHSKVHGQRARVKEIADFSYPFRLAISGLHDNQQIKVTIKGGAAVGVGTEENDFLWAKGLNDFFSDLIQELGSDRRT